MTNTTPEENEGTAVNSKTEVPKDALAALNTAGKRVRVHDAQIVTKLPAAVKELIEVDAAANEVSEATVVRWALADYFAKKGYNA